MNSNQVEGLVRRTQTGAVRLADNAGLFIGRNAPTRQGDVVLGMPSSTLARYGHKTSMAGAAVGLGTFGVDTLTGSNVLGGLNELAAGAFIAGAGASLVASAPASPGHANNPLHLKSVGLRRSMIGGATVAAAANWASAAAGMGGHHTAIGVAALAVGAAGYLGGL